MGAALLGSGGLAGGSAGFGAGVGGFHEEVDAVETAEMGEGSRGGGLGTNVLGLGLGGGAFIGVGAPPCCRLRAAMRSLSEVKTGSSSAIVERWRDERVETVSVSYTWVGWDGGASG